MATLESRWLVFITLVIQTICSALAGGPAPPSRPECHIPCDEDNCRVDIHCTWEQRLEPKHPTNYSLHWEPASNGEGHVSTGNKLSGIIHREDFSYHVELSVWVQANDQYGSAESQKTELILDRIIKPAPPIVTVSNEESSEIHWSTSCQGLLSLGPCEIQHRTEADQVWLKDEAGIIVSYTFDSPQACPTYEVQVRCACGESLMSNWSAISRIKTSDKAPIGVLDVWRDCGISHSRFGCYLTWKRLPASKACGLILGYEVRLSDSDGTEKLMNLSTADLNGELVCDEVKCHLNIPLKDVTSATVSAYNAHGATVPSYLTMTVSGKERNDQKLHLTMNEKNLTVRWNPAPQVSNTLKQYVVQYKQAGSSPGQAFDWVRVNKSQRTATFIGQFKNYTPYQVSVLAVHASEVHCLSSAFGCSSQKTPAKVPTFNVFSISSTGATLHWEPVPLSKQEGLILYYQIGLNGQDVYNVSALPHHENKTLPLRDLSPGQVHEVWIKAVSAAGPGENVTLNFDTKHREFEYSLVLGLIISCVSILCVALFVIFCVCRRENKTCPLMSQCFCEKVPDPRNSRILRQTENQNFNEPMAWNCISVSEPHPKISVLEVVEIQPGASKHSLEKTSDNELTRSLVGEGSSQMDCQDDQEEDVLTQTYDRTKRKFGKEPYSRIVDSDEEREDSCSSSEQEQCTSGYEKHFMPTASDILEVA